jgi:ribosomal-protein-alanine N-acetyltransferase
VTAPPLPPQTQLPRFLTSRLHLAPIELADAGDVFAYVKHPDVLRYTTGVTPERVDQTREFLEGALADPDGRIWAIRQRDQRTVIGHVEFGLPSSEVGSIHYVLAKPYWGRGLMTEAVSAMCTWAFDALPSLRQIETTVAEENVASARVLEKCGFTRAGMTVERWEKQEEPVRLVIFRQSRERG